MKHIVYLTENTINKKLYVGVHSGNNKYYLGSGILLNKAIKKYGRENFKRTILFECESRKEAIFLERIIVPNWLIKRWGNGKYYYNMIRGGKGTSDPLTNEEYLKRVKKIHKGKIKPLENYIDSKTNIDHQCNCGYVWSARPGNIINNKRSCPKCSNKWKRTHDEYIEEINKLFDGQIIPLNKFEKRIKRLKHKCLKCGRIWKAAPNDLLDGKGCKICSSKESGLKQRLSNEEYLERLSKVNKEVIPLELYNGYDIKIKHQHVCGHIWKISPNKLLSGRSCPKCGRLNTIRAKQKKVIAIDENGNEMLYKSISEAARQLNCHHANILKCLSGKYKQTNKYRFRIP